MKPAQNKHLPPGEVLQGLLKLNDIRQSELAERLGRSSQYVTDIIKGKKAMDVELALALEDALGLVTADQWMKYELDYQRAQRATTLTRQSVVAKHRLASELIKLKWVDASGSPQELDRELQAFWALEERLCSNFRGSDAHETNADAKVAWSIQVYRQAMRRNVPAYDAAKLPELIGELKKLMSIERYVARVPELMERYGIRFVLLPHLKKCPVDGVASFNNGQPYIGLSLRIAKLDSFWFVLLHELGHIECEHSGLSADNIELPAQQDPREQEADELARENIMPLTAYRAFLQRARFDLASINREAHRQGIHKAMLLGRLKKDGYLSWDQFGREHPSVREHFAMAH